MLDSTYIYTTQLVFRAFVNDGDNALAADGTKKSLAEIGETPNGYGFALVGADVRSLNIPNITPGNQYFVAVSAINAFGVGASNAPSSVSIVPPLFVPQPPTNVSLAVYPGSRTQLEVSYTPPVSDGGSPVLFYRVELDTTSSFFNPIATTIACPSSNLHTIFQIQTEGINGTVPITSGTFQLVVSGNGASYTTDYISYDAPATMADEEGILLLVPGITVPAPINGTLNFTANVDVTSFLFVNDLLYLSTQTFSAETYTVVAVVGTVVFIDMPLILVNASQATVSRAFGGRGPSTSSPIACVGETSYPVCTLARRQSSGSMQSKLQMLSDLIIDGVSVQRDATPDNLNGYTWRVTFLDPTPSSALDFNIAVLSNSLLGGNGTVTVTKLQAGTSYSACTGTQIVPQTAFLTTGQYYYARVFAINSVGFSLPQIAASSQKPMVVPGPPTSVTLSVLSNSELRVVFNPPVDDGGDAITSYLVQYSTSFDFNPLQSLTVTYLSGGSPYFKTINNLVAGVFVFVRVSAGNSQGYGPAQPSTPASLNPYQSSDAPTNTLLFPTSPTMLTVSFGLPLNDGGDVITTFRVEWDTVSGFNSISPFPNKGSTDLDATSFSSYTIQYLTPGLSYYVRVFALNSAGPGVAALTYPVSAAPFPEVPGKPHTIVATSGPVSGSISVSWLRPRIPWHGIPCSGLPAAPNDCPPMIPGGHPASNGGLPISEYVVSYNNLPDFSGLNNNSGNGLTTTGLSYTLTGLTPGNLYYIRVLARNSQGSGPYCSFVEPNCNIVSVQASAIALP